jgi:hypothetical protein
LQRASVGETQNHLEDGLDQQYFTQSDFDEAWKLSERVMGAITRLGSYLRSVKAAPKRDTRRTDRT